MGIHYLIRSVRPRRNDMKWRRASAVGAVVLALTCGCATEPTFKSPPAGSYTVENRQVRLGDTVSAIQAAAVTLDFFRAAEVRPLLGRFFVEVDEVRQRSNSWS